MGQSIIIAIGGTGAKLAEAFVHLVAAGLGPERTTLFLIDQDSGNGNTARAMRVARAYAEARERWRATGSPHRATDDLFAGELRVAAADVWTPHGPEPLATQLGPMDPDDQALFDLLFHAEHEQRMGLSGGYRGRPNVGAAAMATAIHGTRQPPFWRELTETIGKAAQGETVRVLLMGSLFGGTGAAGFPTLARLIRDHAAAKRLAGNLSVGGVLMLPYFGFGEAAADAEGDAKNVARADELLLQSRGALEHYADLMAREPNLLNAMYLVGADPLVNLGYHQPQGGAQVNPPLFPELVAAMGGAAFLRDGPTEEGAVLAAALRDANGVGWHDLPDAGAYAGLGGLLRLAVAWRHWGPLVMKPRKLMFFALDEWARKQRLGKHDEAAGQWVDALNQYFAPLLEWAAATEAYARAGGAAFTLWNTGALLDGSANLAQPWAPVRLDALDDEGRYSRAFDTLIVPAEGADPPPPASAVLAGLNTPGNADATGLGMFLTALRRETRV